MAERRRAGTTYPPARSLVLCAAPRTGSTLLCELLTGTEVMGFPKEPFAPASIAACCSAWGTPGPEEAPEAYLRAAVRNGTSPDGTFGTKIMWEHLEGLRRWCGCADAAGALSLFPRPHALLITRRDKVAAAVSWVRASTTGAWSATGGDARPRPGSVDVDRITAAHRAQHEAEDGWRALLATRPDVPADEIAYEDLATDHHVALATAARLLGRDAPGPSVPPTLAVQRDDWTAEAAARWVEVTGGCGACTSPSDVGPPG